MTKFFHGTTTKQQQQQQQPLKQGSNHHYSLCVWSLKLATIFSVTGSNFCVIHVDYVDFVPELGWRFRSRNIDE